MDLDVKLVGEKI